MASIDVKRAASSSGYGAKPLFVPVSMPSRNSSRDVFGKLRRMGVVYNGKLEHDMDEPINVGYLVEYGVDAHFRQGLKEAMSRLLRDMQIVGLRPKYCPSSDYFLLFCVYNPRERSIRFVDDRVLETGPFMYTFEAMMNKFSELLDRAKFWTDMKSYICDEADETNLQTFINGMG
jgi:hypothetical protein